MVRGDQIQKWVQTSSQRERESVCGHVLVSGSLCHARTDEEEVEVWEAEMDDGFHTI